MRAPLLRSSWPGLPRPSTSLSIHAKTWMPGIGEQSDAVLRTTMARHDDAVTDICSRPAAAPRNDDARAFKQTLLLPSRVPSSLRARGRERHKQPPCGVADFIHGAGKSRFVGVRRMGEAA